MLNASGYLTLIIDDADKSAYDLSNFATNTKAERGRSRKDSFICKRHHSVPKLLRLLTMSEEHKTGDNQIVETLHRALTDIRIDIPLPKRL